MTAKKELTKADLEEKILDLVSENKNLNKALNDAGKIIAKQKKKLKKAPVKKSKIFVHS